MSAQRLAEEETTLGRLTINGRHDKSYLHGIRGAGKVCVNLLRLVLVEGNESVQDVVRRGLVIATACLVSNRSPTLASQTYPHSRGNNSSLG
jgi:hypothetical protein